MGLCVALALCGVACQPMYAGKPERLHNPPIKHPPPDEAAAPVAYVEDCSANFQDDPKKARLPQPQVAAGLLANGVTALHSADKATDANTKINFLKDAVDKLRNALMKDPYNADATLKLAIAYDRVLRKGCALAMLKRLSQMAGHKTYGAEATRKIDDIDANGAWFKGYRKDAMAAVGR